MIVATDASNGRRSALERETGLQAIAGMAQGIGSGLGLDGNTLVIASAYGFVAP